MHEMSADNDTPDSILPRLRLVLRDFINDPSIDDIGDDIPLAEVLESLGHFTFLLSLEGIFNTEIPDHKFTPSEMGTLAGVASVLRECLQPARDI